MLALLIGIWNIIIGFWVVFIGFIGITITLVTSFYYLMNALFKVGVGFYQIFSFMFDSYVRFIGTMNKQHVRRVCKEQNQNEFVFNERSVNFKIRFELLVNQRKFCFCFNKKQRIKADIKVSYFMIQLSDFSSVMNLIFEIKFC